MPGKCPERTRFRDLGPFDMLAKKVAGRYRRESNRGCVTAKAVVKSGKLLPKRPNPVFFLVARSVVSVGGYTQYSG
jgi:hypothetical protein